jgi:amino acid adenylation domain-containing protein
VDSLVGHDQQSAPFRAGKSSALSTATAPVMYPERCVHQLFEDQAEARPDSIALIFQEEIATYRQLNERANELASELRERGMGPEKLVGLYLGNCVEQIVAMIAVLKTGAGFLPLETSYPENRIAYMIEDAQLSLILTLQTQRSLVPSANVPIVCVDESPLLRGNTNINVPRYVCLDNTACVLYTSGSTGKPKGVIRTHRGIVHRLAWASFGADDVFCHNMSLSFGFSQERLFLPLMRGLPLVIISDEASRNPRELLSTLWKTGVTNITMAPVMLNALLQLPPEDWKYFAKLRSVASAGTALSPELVASFMNAMPDTKLVNAYGTTESGSVIRGRIVPGHMAARPPLGRPVRTARAYIVDSAGLQAPVGTVGELYISAPCLARGYLHRPELTAERFRPNPFDGAVGERMYATGDLARYLETGEVEFVGRADRQVKVRGFRVELGEVESLLKAHGGLENAVAVARGNREDAELVAYVVLRKGVATALSELRRYMQEHAAPHMIPSRFVVLDELPLAPNGKVIVEALPTPAAVRPCLDVPFEPPRTPAEIFITNLCAKLLGIEEVGIRDNLLELGGNSITAAQAVARIRERLGIEVPFATLFVGTLAEVAEECTQRESERING